MRFFVSQAGRGGGAGVLGGGWAQEAWQTKSPQLGCRRKGGGKNTNNIPITFLKLGGARPFIEKSAAPWP